MSLQTENTIIFTVSNGSVFESYAKKWKISNYISEIVKETEDSSPIYISLSHISLEYLIKVEEFLNIYSDNTDSWVDIEKPIHSLNIYEIVRPIYAEYIDKMTEEELKKIVIISDYLDIKPLIDLASVKLATFIKPSYDTGNKAEVLRVLV